MDGNRRWAKERNLLPWIGHKKGVEAAQRTIDFCIDQKIPYLTLYVLSAQNLQRPEQELLFVYNLVREFISDELDNLLKRRIAVRVVGDRTLFPDVLHDVIAILEEQTIEDPVLCVTALFCYGSQEEIVSAARAIGNSVQSGALSINDISSDLFSQFLWTAPFPPPDLIIRTGGDHRLSNFLLFQAAYSELYFTDLLWPDITQTDLQIAADYFNSCKRRFGR